MEVCSHPVLQPNPNQLGYDRPKQLDGRTTFPAARKFVGNLARVWVFGLKLGRKLEKGPDRFRPLILRPLGGRFVKDGVDQDLPLPVEHFGHGPEVVAEQELDSMPKLFGMPLFDLGADVLAFQPLAPTFRPTRLLALQQDEIAQRQHVHLGAHEAAIGIGKRTDNRFSADIKGRVDDQRATRPPLEGLNQVIKDRMVLALDRLNASRVVDVCNRRDIAANAPHHGQKVVIVGRSSCT